MSDYLSAICYWVPRCVAIALICIVIVAAAGFLARP